MNPPAPSPPSRLGRRVAALVAGVGGVAIVHVLDRALAGDIVVSNLYLVPVAATAWYAGLLPGLAVAGVATAASAAVGPAGDPLARIGMPLLLNAALAWFATTLHHAFARERRLARTDAVTGAQNRLAFDERARGALREHAATGRPLTAVCLDLDGFKAVNDKLGHAEGDRVLRVVAETLLGAVRGSDVVARYGGDEFAVLLPDTDERGAREVLERLRAAVSAETQIRGWPVTCSIGAVTFRGLPRNERELMAPVDAQMYAAKQGGKDRVFHEIREAVRKAG